MKQNNAKSTHQKKTNDRLRYKKVIILASVFVIILGIAVLLYAMLLEKNILKHEDFGHLPMAKDAAFCFILSGFALVAAIKSGKFLHVLSKILALVIVASASLSVAQNHVPEFYHRIFVLSNHIYFGMAMQTAIAFIFTGLALCFIRIKKARLPVQFLLHSVTLISGVVIFGHILRIPHFYHFTIFDAMSIYTAVGLLIFTVAASLFNPSAGLTGIYTGNKIGNVMARRLSVRILVVLFIITYFRIMAHRNEWLSQELGMAMFALAFLITTLVLIFATSVVLNEIGDKKEIAKHNFKALVKSAPNALVMSDTEGKIALVNKEANKIFGYSPNELEGSSLDIIVPERYRAAHQEKYPKYAENPQPRHFSSVNDLYALRKDGSEFPIEIGITPIKTEKGIVALASIIDITERKQSEAIIKKQMSELKMKNYEMEQFTYIASHDLQEPLRTVSNYIRLLEEDYPEQINDDIGTHLAAMDAAINRMRVLVRSLLDYGRLGQNKKLVRTNTNTVINNVADDLKSLISSSNSTITCASGLPEINAYETELRQLFQNLINNAIKFRKKDIAPIITIGCNQQNGISEFYIADNGIGIDPKHSERIFMMFHQLKGNEEYEGYGVGLANCKKIAELHGGKIWVESEPGKGSTFKFTIAPLTNE